MNMEQATENPAPGISTKPCWRCKGEGTVHLWGANWRVCRLCKGEGVIIAGKKPAKIGGKSDA